MRAGCHRASSTIWGRDGEHLVIPELGHARSYWNSQIQSTMCKLISLCNGGRAAALVYVCQRMECHWMRESKLGTDMSFFAEGLVAG